MRVSQELMNAPVRERVCFKPQDSHTGTCYVGTLLPFVLFYLLCLDSGEVARLQ